VITLSITGGEEQTNQHVPVKFCVAFCLHDRLDMLPGKILPAYRVLPHVYVVFMLDMHVFVTLLDVHFNRLNDA